MHDITNAQAIHRQDDQELMGYILQDTDKWLALTIFGYALATVASQDEAAQIVTDKGLDALMDTWQYFDPAQDDWFNCTIIEAKKDTLTIRISDYGHPDALQTFVIHHPNNNNFKK